MKIFASGRLLKKAQKVAENILAHTILPAPECIVCGSSNGLRSGICADCMDMLDGFRIRSSGCPICGAANAAGVCENCENSIPTFTRARSAYHYKGVARTLIHQLKFHGNPQIAARIFAPAMTQILLEMMPDADCLIPVPLSRNRIFERGYNQSTYLAAHIKRLHPLPIREDLLYRNRETSKQSALSHEAREENVFGAFTALSAAKGLRVVLIDDVVTTCGTVSACSKALLLAGVKDICVVSAARADSASDR